MPNGEYPRASHCLVELGAWYAVAFDKIQKCFAHSLGGLLNIGLDEIDIRNPHVSLVIELRGHDSAGLEGQTEIAIIVGESVVFDEHLLLSRRSAPLQNRHCTALLMISLSECYALRTVQHFIDYLAVAHRRQVVQEYRFSPLRNSLHYLWRNLECSEFVAPGQILFRYSHSQPARRVDHIHIRGEISHIIADVD